VVKTSADGTINVVGDPEHSVSRGALCGKCSIGYNGVWRDPSMRLTRPLKRVGPKGTGRFEPASWVEALGDIANRLNTIRSRDGSAAILHTHYTHRRRAMRDDLGRQSIDVGAACASVLARRDARAQDRDRSDSP
jgi:anaerobic selenocysteine-containing dehydrogenase